MPISSDQVMKWIDVTYTDEDGNQKAMPRLELERNSYFAYAKMPATEAHKNMKLTIKLMIGSITKDVTAGADAVIHNPRLLRAEMLTDVTTAATAGAIELKWKVRDPKVTDLFDGDMFLVERSLTGLEDDFETIGYTEFNANEEEYTFRDTLLTSTLLAEHIDRAIGIPLVRYRVVRSSAKELWTIEHNPTAAYVQPQMATLSLLRPKDAKASWLDQAERTVQAEWGYTPSDDSHNYVWDNRAHMLMEVQTFRRDGTPVAHRTG